MYPTPTRVNAIHSLCLSLQVELDALGQLVKYIQTQVDVLLVSAARGVVMPLYADARGAACCHAAGWAYVQWCAATAGGKETRWCEGAVRCTSSPCTSLANI